MQDVVFNPIENEYVISFFRSTAYLEQQVFIQRFDADSLKAKDIAQQVSSMDAWAPRRRKSSAVSKLAFDSNSNQYLVVWKSLNTLTDGEDMWGQLLDSQGREIGEDFPVTTYAIGRTDGLDRIASQSVVFNADRNEYVVVYQRVVGEMSPFHDGGTMARMGQYTIERQRIAARTGQRIGGGLRIGHENGDPYYHINPSIVYNSVEQEYLVAWQVSAMGQMVVTQRLRGSDARPVGQRVRAADFSNGIKVTSRKAQLSFSEDTNQYVLSFIGRYSVSTEIVQGEEIFVRLLNADNTLVSNEPTRITELGPEAGRNGRVRGMVVANGIDNRYMVAYTTNHIGRTYNVFGQLIEFGLNENGDEQEDVSGDGNDGDDFIDIDDLDPSDDGDLIDIDAPVVDEPEIADTPDSIEMPDIEEDPEVVVDTDSDLEPRVLTARSMENASIKLQFVVTP